MPAISSKILLHSGTITHFVFTINYTYTCACKYKEDRYKFHLMYNRVVVSKEQ
jgi:hypothetical protein